MKLARSEDGLFFFPPCFFLEMLTAKSVAEYRVWRKSLQLQPGERLGFFPTMGALHEGHLDLARQARKECKVVVSSIFVNPAQFAAHEDLGTYPRTEEQDLKVLEAQGVDMVFLPTSAMMYPPEFDTWVQTDVGSGRNEGAVRPHFFKGVATVCTKLFNIIQPDVVYFGQKDAQQCVVIEHIVRDLNMDIQVTIVPTHREPDGLAMSSRNAYLRYMYSTHTFFFTLMNSFDACILYFTPTRTFL